MDVQPREIPMCQVPGLCGLHVVDVPGDSPTFAFRCKFSDETRSEPFGLDRAVEIWQQWPDDGGMKPNLWRAIHDCCTKLVQRGWGAMALGINMKLLSHTQNPYFTLGIAMDIAYGLVKMERWEESVVYFRRALATEAAEPNISYRLKNDIGYCLYRMGQLQEAERWLREALHSDQRDFAAHKNLGVVLQAQGRFAEAAGCLAAALDVSPMEPKVLRSIVSLLLEHPQVREDADDSVDKIRELVNRPLPVAGTFSTAPQPSSRSQP